MTRPIEKLLADYGADAGIAAREGICPPTARDWLARLTPGSRLQLIADLGAGLPPGDCRAAARAFLAALPSRDGESALAQALRVCGDVAVDEVADLTPEQHAAAVLTGAEAAHELLREPRRALALIEELAQGLPGAAHVLLLVRAAGPAEVQALAQGVGAKVERTLNVAMQPPRVKHEAQAGLAVIWCEEPAKAEDLVELLPKGGAL